MRKPRNQIKNGMVLSYLNLILGNLIPIFYLPIMLSLLGKSEYGLYKLAANLTSYLTLIAFGIGGSITRYVLKANLEGGKAAEQRLFGLFDVMYHIVSVGVLAVGIFLALNLEWFYSEALSADELFIMRVLVIILTVNTAVQMVSIPYTTIVSAHERFIFVQLMTIINTVAAPVLNLIMLLVGFRSIGMVAGTLGLTIVTRIAYLVYCRTSLDLKPVYKQMPFHLTKEILIFSFWVFLSNVTSMLFGATDTVIIGAVPALAATGVAVYSVGHQFSGILIGLAQVVPGFFMPRANKMVLSGSNSTELTDLTIKVGRIQGYLVALFCFGFVAFGRQFLTLYVGPGYEQAYWVAVVVMIPNCIQLVQSAFISVMQAKNMHSFRAKTYTFFAVANAVATYFLVKDYGIIGAAVPTALCYLLGNGLLMNWFYWKKMEMQIPRFWKCMIPVFVPAVILCVIVLVMSVWIDFSYVPAFILGVACFTFIYGFICWKAVLNEEEKELCLQQLRKIKHRKGKT